MKGKIKKLIFALALTMGVTGFSGLVTTMAAETVSNKQESTNTATYGVELRREEVYPGIYLHKLYINGKWQSDFTGLQTCSDGKTYCINNGIMVQTGAGLHQVKGVRAGWYYFDSNHTVITNYKGFAKNNYGEWYVVDGKVQFATGVIWHNGNLYVIRGGATCRNENGLVKVNETWVYVKNGVVELTYNGLVPNKWGWWYVRAGYVDFSYKGFVKNNAGEWYVVGGKVDFATGLVWNNGKLHVVRNGALCPNESGVVKVGETWAYVKNGLVEVSYSGLAQNYWGWWYVESGIVRFDVNSVVKGPDGIWRKVTNGKVDFNYTGFEKNAWGWWYLENGKLENNPTEDNIKLVLFALKHVGNPYVWGGNSLTNGCDCSGFVHLVCKEFGYDTPRYSLSFANVGTAVNYNLSNPNDISMLQIGDIVVYEKNSDGIGHVAIYIGNGRIVEAQSTATGITCNRSVVQKNRDIIAVRRLEWK